MHFQEAITRSGLRVLSEHTVEVTSIVILHVVPGWKGALRVCCHREDALPLTIWTGPAQVMTTHVVALCMAQGDRWVVVIGDRILSLNDNDVRNATEQNVIDLIRAAGQIIHLLIQTFDISEPKNQKSNSTLPAESDIISNGAQSEGPTTNKAYLSPEGSDDEDDDTRDMTGRMLTQAGYEIDRASAGNVKRGKSDSAADPEQEDEFGYTTNKIKKRYGNLGPVHKTEVIRPPNADLGIALSGHKDRTKMACIVAGVNPSGIAGSANLKAGDEILEVNGNVLQNRCHLNASVIFSNLPSEKVTFVVLRRPKISEVLAVKPVVRFPASIDETEYLFTAYKNVRKLQIQKAGASLGIMIIEGKHVEVGNGIFVSDLQDESNAMKAGLQVGEMILAINKDVIVDSNYDTLKQSG